MSMFQSPKPRGFQHHYLYVDERKERLKEIHQRAMTADKKSELNSSYSSSSIQGLFRKSSRQKQSSHFTFLLVGLFCLVILIALLLFVTTVSVTPANF
ncbi:hypothetical protein [Hoylesella timonensis]|uniref:hypothetical protein n=1 Tax=Hoylesella timonensis TaxID=386414 RepID=UPI000560F748|nr:hypothetical protein [Hoylesella timonensis]